MKGLFQSTALGVVCLLVFPGLPLLGQVPTGNTLPGTQPLTLKGDIASELVAGTDRFLLKEIEASVEQRKQHWKRDFTSEQALEDSVKGNRERLAAMLGVRDERTSFKRPRVLVEAPVKAGVSPQSILARGDGFDIYEVRWPVVRTIHGEGLLLLPRQGEARGDVIVVPDADETPEQLAGLTFGYSPEAQVARRLASSGYRVLVPSLIDRTKKKRNGRASLTSREFLYRSAFELGRHVVGYEVQKILAGVDWFVREAPGGDPSVAVLGHGEGGMLALYAGALDTRIDAVLVSGHFESRQGIWSQPIDRNVFGLLREFGDAELASLIFPRHLVVEAARGPELSLDGGGGAPAKLASPSLDAVRAEFKRLQKLVPQWDGQKREGYATTGNLRLVETRPDGQGTPWSPMALKATLEGLGHGEPLSSSEQVPQHIKISGFQGTRQQRQMDEMDQYNQWLLRESPYVRQAFMADLKTDSLENYEASLKHYRDFFYDKVIGRFDHGLLPANARTRKTYDKDNWVGYEVVLDVFPDVIAYGILIVPKDLRAGEKRPVVVCQHGLEGRPQDIIEGDHRAYHDYAAKLAEEGFITFSPQNLYIFHDRFRTLQRKANPLGKTLFSIITPQHQQIIHWLKTLPYVDAERIAFYGLSYGGKTAMRVPALLEDYCLSICSADFNEWVWKNASTRSHYSYVWTGEYEIFEFDLGSTFNYAEMAALIAPRPFMVERGHFDGVAPDETVGYEFAKVRHLYAARLKIPDRCEIEWFAGPHTIHGKGTFEFLKKHLRFPESGVRSPAAAP